MKKFYQLLFVFIGLTGLLKAQPYGNEWINFATNQPYSIQQYFKVNVWRDGVYRITYADLQSAAFPLTINPKQLQLFYMGQEQFIHVEGESDGVLDPADYIEFYGLKNDGRFDNHLYRNPDDQLNKNFSLFTDTSAYFLTVNANPFAVNKRMVMETDVNFIGYNPIPYFIREAFQDYKNEYNVSNIATVVESEYDLGEGWFAGQITNSPIPFPLATPNVSQDPTAPLAIATATVMGGNNTGEQHAISLTVAGTTVSNNFYAFEVTRFNFPIASNTALTGNNTSFTLTPGSGVTNRTMTSFIQLTYPHTLSYANENANVRKMTIPGNLSPNKSLLSFTNLSMTGPKLFMLSNDTVKQVTVVGSGTSWQALVPTYNADKFCFITDTVYTQANGNLSITPITNDPSHFAQFINYQYISQADYLIITHKTLWNKATDYKNYRTTTGYNTLLVDVDELYNQFAYGIAKHPLAIRNFCEFTVDTFTVKPQYLLLLGKSVSPVRTRIGASNQSPTATLSNYNKNLVPTFGYPPSDMLLVSGFNDTIPRPEIAVGRISASTEVDVQSYLDKLVAHDLQLQQCPQEWMKQILHFGGGQNIYQQDQIKTILRGFENIVEDTLFGGNVTTFLKTSSDPIQVNLSQYLQALIDSGVTMMTFVAHASGTTFDISTDLPQNYRNKDRYPLVLANSCFVGDIHDPARRIVEDFVLLPDKGAIAFVAQPSVGYLENLELYSSEFYQQIASTNYGGTVGRTMRNVIDSVFNNPVVNATQYTYYMYKSVCTGMTMSGDPALVLNSFDKPDYELSQGNVFFTPQLITTELDSFDVNVVIKNLGRMQNQPFVLHIDRKFPDGTVYHKDTILYNVAYKDTIILRLPVDAIKGVGPNQFDVFVDYLSNIDECREYNNNLLGILLLIQSSDIIPVYPTEFAIVPNNNIKLKASTANPFAPVRNYVFQIDTVDRFNSSFKQEAIVSSPGGVVQWQLPFTLQPDLVYYWRVSRDSLPTDTIHPTWRESSFIHKPQLTGWSQAHYSQFKKDKFTNVIYTNDYDSTFKFVESASTLFIRDFKNPYSPTKSPTVEINNVVEEYDMCGGTPSIHVVVIDSVSLALWTNENHNFGNYNVYIPGVTATCRQRYEKYFIFRDNPAQLALMKTMLEDSIPNGDFVAVYSVFNVNYSAWDPALKATFSSWGSDSINFLDDGDPYIFFTKKGDNSKTQESVGDSINTYITLSATLGGNWSKGFVNSVVVGPAVNWDSFHWQQAPLESTAGSDSVAVDIIGIMANGQEVPLSGFTGIQTSTTDLNINSIDATTYPKLRLQAYVQDEQLFTPPQLKRWQIYYDEIPELALNPAKYFKLNKDTLAEGEEVSMQMAIENIGDVNADSVLVDFYVYDKNRVRHNLSSPRYKTMAPGDTIIGSVSFSTTGYPGLNSLWIEANPNFDQPEQYHFNNLAEILFDVNRDITNPILDVTFDGTHILNGDIVSGKPYIQIKLKDENKYLALNDTSDWQVFLKDPEGIQRKLSFEPLACAGIGGAQLKWCPANLPQNTFRIEFKPELLKDGVYELWVQASDASGNISGDNNYKITFEVINKATITEVVNYPNPFSTSTRFVFTLTGSEIPEYIKIQIMTVTGKVIREITRDELGPIRIGRNITEYAWNGKDEFGDQLANGVYLYRVISLLNGGAIEKRETEADKYFTKGWGKMYLMR